LSIYGREHNVQKEDVFLGKPNIHAEKQGGDQLYSSYKCLASSGPCLVSEPSSSKRECELYIVFLLVIFLCVCGQAHFNVVNGARKGQPWGMFTCDRSVPNGRNGPLYEEPEDIEHEFATKVSSVNDPVKAVLIGRLRFKPDSLDPTTSK